MSTLTKQNIKDFIAHNPIETMRQKKRRLKVNRNTMPDKCLLNPALPLEGVVVLEKNSINIFRDYRYSDIKACPEFERITCSPLSLHTESSDDLYCYSDINELLDEFCTKKKVCLKDNIVLKEEEDELCFFCDENNQDPFWQNWILLLFYFFF